MKNNLTDQTYWDKEYTYTALAGVPKEHPIARLIYTYFKPDGGAVCEIGCFPGSFLYHFGELGYELHGIDGTPRIKEMETFIHKKGYRLGTLTRGDFFTWNAPRTYDVVCSFGFIEHFKDYESLIQQHIDLLAPGGSLMITTPNFAGSFQRCAHQTVDSENLKRHNLDSMNPEAWTKICRTAGLEIVYAGYTGKFAFWAESAQRNLAEKFLYYAIAGLAKILRKIIFFESRMFSPFCVIIAKKP